jgi:hypothetical protein
VRPIGGKSPHRAARHWQAGAANGFDRSFQGRDREGFFIRIAPYFPQSETPQDSRGIF